MIGIDMEIVDIAAAAIVDNSFIQIEEVSSNQK